MLDTALANLRFGISMVRGRRIHIRSLEHIEEAMRQTQAELGAIGGEAADMVGGLSLDEDTRRMVQERAFRRQAIRAAAETPYYEALFARHNVDPRRLRFEDIARLPVTPKDDLRNDPEAFVRNSAGPCKRTTTTGTTGWPTTVFFSDYEMRLIGGLAAISFITRRLIQPEDMVQISISTRATLGVTGVSRAAAATGASLHVAGLLSPEHTLALLAERHRLVGKRSQVSVMSTYPSYLGLLVEEARRQGRQASDFGLRRVLTGGEVLTEGLERRCRELFGPELEIVQNYGMTELAPFGGNLCSQGHLHFEPSAGLAEVQALDEPRPAEVGEPGVIVGTPLPPYRETTMLLRYDTEDVARRLGEGLTCELRGTPATSNLLGKRRLSVRHEHGWTFLRDVQESLDAVDAVPLPARYGFWAVPGGVAVEVVAGAGARREITSSLEGRGVPLQKLNLVDDPGRLRHPIPLRCDMREGSLATVSRPSALAAVTGGLG